MIDEEPAADLGAGMNLDAGEEAGGLADEARQGRQAPPVERMRHTVALHGPKPGIAEQDLGPGRARWVAVTDGAAHFENFHQSSPAKSAVDI